MLDALQNDEISSVNRDQISLVIFKIFQENGKDENFNMRLLPHIASNIIITKNSFILVHAHRKNSNDEWSILIEINSDTFKKTLPNCLSMSDKFLHRIFKFYYN